MKKRAHIFVSGKVQGVYFRERTRGKAEKLSVSGWVMNLPDGRVEAIFEGEEKSVNKMVKWANRGPFWAKVEKMDLAWEDYKDEFNCFEVRYSIDGVLK